MRQNTHAQSPFGPFPLGAASSLEQALTDIMHVVELLSALATCEQDIAARVIYPAADQLRRCHREAVDAMEMILAGGRAEVSA